MICLTPKPSQSFFVYRISRCSELWPCDRLPRLERQRKAIKITEKGFFKGKKWKGGFLIALVKAIKKEPTTSVTKHINELKVDEETVRTITKQDLSSDVKPLGNTMWGDSENKTNSTSIPNIGSLKTAIAEEWIKISEEFISKARKSFCYIARYMDVWNRHRESNNTKLYEISSGTKLFIIFEFKGYLTWGERDTTFLCWLLLHLPQTTCDTPSANYWSGLGGPRKSTFPFGRRNSTHCFFSNSSNPQTTLPVHDVTHTSWSYFLSGVLFWHLWKTHPPPTRMNTCAYICA